MSRLRDFYNTEIIPEMTKKFSYTNKLAVPKIEKIIINMGVGEAKENAKVLDGAVKDMATISGQKPLVTKAKKSVANFKLREGMNIGCKVTLRGDRMYEFADRLINIALCFFKHSSASRCEEINMNLKLQLNAFTAWPIVCRVK